MTLQLFPVTICETWKKTIPIISASREAAREDVRFVKGIIEKVKHNMFVVYKNHEFVSIQDRKR